MYETLKFITRQIIYVLLVITIGYGLYLIHPIILAIWILLIIYEQLQ